jgi:hypothetical protein
MAGGLMLLLGMMRYWPWSRATVLTLHLMMVGLGVSFTLMGLAFFVFSLADTDDVTISSTLLLIYALFGGSAASMFFVGGYAFLGAGKGWIIRDAYKFPWSDYRARNESDGE